MRCSCCDAELSDAEATARFAASGNYVEMCKVCVAFLPKDLKIITRPDLEKKGNEPVVDDPFDLGDGDGDVWDDS